jgi:hypothetical protein
LSLSDSRHIENPKTLERALEELERYTLSISKGLKRLARKHKQISVFFKLDVLLPRVYDLSVLEEICSA